MLAQEHAIPVATVHANFQLTLNELHICSAKEAVWVLLHVEQI